MCKWYAIIMYSPKSMNSLNTQFKNETLKPQKNLLLYITAIVR